MVGIWCVELVSQENTGRWARRGCRTLTFDTEEEAMAEVRKLRAKHGYLARGRWLFFVSPIGAKIDISEPQPLLKVEETFESRAAVASA